MLGMALVIGLTACGAGSKVTAEDSVDECTNGRDDDGDDAIDCADQDCWAFSVCADAGPDSDGDSDGDSDTDADSDADADTDTDSDSDVCTGDPWQIEVADEEGAVGWTPSLALDTDGVAHVAYGDETGGNLAVRYATNASGAWESVDIGDAVGARGPSLAVDDERAAHVSFVNQAVAPYDLHYATNASGDWTSDVARSGSNFSSATTSLVLDDSGSPHIAHVRSEGAGAPWIDHTYVDGGDWTFEPVANVPVAGVVSMASDGAGNLAIATTVSAGISFSTNETGSWVTTTVEDVGVHKARMAIDGDDVPHLVYLDERSTLRHAWRTGGVWDFENVDDSGLAEEPALAFGADGSVHVSYVDQIGLDLLYATNASGGWISERVDEPGNVGQQSSIAIDSAGRPWIAYLDWAGGDTNLLVARRCK